MAWAGLVVALAVPLAAAVTAHRAASSLPFDIAEEAALARPGGLAPALRPLADLTTSHAAWRVAGACALALAGCAVACAAFRISGSAVAGGLLGLVVVTHAEALRAAADVRGAAELAGIALAATGALVVGRRPVRIGFAAVLVAAAFAACWAGPRNRRDGELLAVALNRAPDSTVVSLLTAALSCLAAIGGLAFWRRRPELRVMACGGALAFAAIGTATALKDLAREGPRRAEVSRFLAAVDAVPPAGSGEVELIVGAPCPPGPDLALARPGRRLARTPAEIAGASRVRLARWGAPQDDGLLAMLPKDLVVVLDGTVDRGVRLVAPADGVVLRAREPEDEPEFRFTVEGAAPCAHDVRIILVAETSAGTKLVVRELDEATLQSSEAGAASTLAWRPSWRPMCHAERELRWEDGDVCEPGGTVWWTVAIVEDAVTRMAPFRRVSLAR
jgi:hypothetical protein